MGLWTYKVDLDLATIYDTEGNSFATTYAREAIKMVSMHNAEVQAELENKPVTFKLHPSGYLITSNHEGRKRVRLSHTAFSNRSSLKEGDTCENLYKHSDVQQAVYAEGLRAIEKMTKTRGFGNLLGPLSENQHRECHVMFDNLRVPSQPDYRTALDAAIKHAAVCAYVRGVADSKHGDPK